MSTDLIDLIPFSYRSISFVHKRIEKQSNGAIVEIGFASDDLLGQKFFEIIFLINVTIGKFFEWNQTITTLEIDAHLLTLIVFGAYFFQDEIGRKLRQLVGNDCFHN